MRRQESVQGSVKKFVFPLACLGLGLFPDMGGAQTLTTPSVDVIGVTPVMGTGVDRDTVPSSVQSLSAGDMQKGQSTTIEDALNRRLGSISTSDYNGNPLQAGMSFRGFNASPVVGDPQGLAVYQGGMRVNESFGDTVNWDLIPVFAIHQMDVLPGSNPVFGLNALGGAISMGMKNGFNTKGTTIDLSGGTYGREKLTAETAMSSGEWGFYTGASGLNDYGWRARSPSRVAQNYTDIVRRTENSEVGIGVTLGASYLSNFGGVPDELRSLSRTAYFTGPDNQRNSVAAVDLRGSHDITDDLSLQGTAYFRHLRIAVTNGNTSNNQACGAVLCDANNNQLFDRNGNSINAANTYVINDTLTLTDSYGTSLQVTQTGTIAGRPNLAIAGVAFDAGDTRYMSEQLAGQLDGDRLVQSSGQVIGGKGNYVGFVSRNRYMGLYGTDSLTVLPGVTATIAARYNTAHIEMRDQYGTALTANHNYDRLNPSAGVTWKVLSATTVFANYSEANRVPTPAELSCADPNQPCYVPNGFQADPSLGQVTSRSWEGGVRGELDIGAFNGHWSTTGFHTTNSNDIYFVADSNIAGSGYFRNIGETQRNGFEGNVDGKIGKATLFASYTLLRATFESPMTIGSRSPAASGNQQIYVTPGKVMPGIPLHSLKFGGSYQICPDFSLGGDTIIKSGVFLRGDENNTQAPTNAYAVVNLDANWMATEWMSLYVRVNNLFNQKYETAGQYGDGSAVFANYSANDRFLSSGMPFNAWIGTRVTF